MADVISKKVVGFAVGGSPRHIESGDERPPGSHEGKPKISKKKKWGGGQETSHQAKALLQKR